MAVDIDAVIERYDRLSASRSQWESQWRELAEYVLPRRADFNRIRPQGDRRPPRGFDSTAAWANEQLAAALHGLLTGPTAPWFQLRAQDAEADDDAALRAWLDEAGRRMMAVFNSPASNFQSQIHEVYLDICCLGSGALYVEEGAGGVRFSARSLAECCFEDDADGRIEGVYRRFTLTARQAAALWGAAAGEAVARALRDPGGVDQPLAFLHVVRPRRARGEGAMAADMAFESLYIALEDRTLIAEGGYRDMPYMTPRWSKVAGETYGRSPAMTALPDIRMIDAMARTVIQAAEKAAAPPLIVPDDGFALPISTAPNSLIFRRTGFGAGETIQPLQTGGSVNIGLEMMERVREQILRAFNVDWFNLAPAPGMTATEVVARQQERMRLIGPMIGRLQSELLGPLVTRVFGLLLRRGVFGPPPVDLAEIALKVDYVSPVAKAQRQDELFAIDGLRRAASELAALDPAAAQAFDAEAALRRTAAILGAPSGLLRAETQP